ncbi:Protein NETWORKED 4A [Glycine max]|nr:Protein NETWORKED 4A [Glycine max]
MTKRSLTSEMERNVRQMQKLMEEDGDSFAQKAEMYYKKRPELISLVEEFYRAYKSMAERFDHINTPCDLQSQASGVSDYGSEPNSYVPSPSPRKMGRRISTNRAAGFDVFLGSGGNVNTFDACQKDGDGSSTLTETDEDYDDASSMNSFSGFFGNGNDHNSIHRRVMELDIEIPHEGKEKHEEERVKNDELKIENNAEDFRVKINAYEQELRIVNEKLRVSEEEIGKLKIELEKYRSMESKNLKGGVGLSSIVEGIKVGGETLELKKLREELRVTKEKLESSEMQIVSLKFGATKTFETIQQLQEQLDLAQKDIASWKTKFNSQKRENSKLQERHARMKTNVADRDHEVRDLKAALSDVERKIFFERANMKSEMSKLLGEQTHLEEKFKEWECQCQSLEEEIRKIYFEKIEMGETLKGEIELLKEEIESKKKNIEDVNVNLDVMKLDRDNLKEEVGSLKEVINSRDDEIEEAHKQVEELTSRAKKQEEEIERQRVEILEGAEEKREAIRQLCFSLEHYRNGYNVLRQAFIGNKRVPLLCT